jgi:cation transport ATPase
MEGIMEKEHLHGYLSPTLPPLNQKTIHTLNYQAAQDFSKRSIPGAFIILLLMISCLYSSTVFNDAQILISILLSLLSLSVFSRFFIIKDLKNHLHDKKLNQWKQIFSLAVLLTAFVWGIFASINFYLYGLNTAVLIIFMFTIAIAGGSAISLIIWKRLAHVYLAFSEFSFDIINSLA